MFGPLVCYRMKIIQLDDIYSPHYSIYDYKFIGDNGLSTIEDKLIQILHINNAKWTMDTVFDAYKIPFIGTKAYIRRLTIYAQCGPRIWVYALVLLDRFLLMNGDINLTYINVHRLLLTAFVIGLKIYEDFVYSNPYYANVGGVDNQELFRMERTFLRLMDWEIAVTQEDVSLPPPPPYKNNLFCG